MQELHDILALTGGCILLGLSILVHQSMRVSAKDVVRQRLRKYVADTRPGTVFKYHSLRHKVLALTEAEFICLMGNLGIEGLVKQFYKVELAGCDAQEFESFVDLPEMCNGVPVTSAQINVCFRRL